LKIDDDSAAFGRGKQHPWHLPVIARLAGSASRLAWRSLLR
jgi:hypothetical protein